MSYRFTKDDDDNFSAYETVNTLLSTIRDEAEKGKATVTLQGFTTLEARAVFYLLAYSMAISRAQGKGPAEEETTQTGETKFHIPGVGILTSHADKDHKAMVISIQTEGNIPIHAMKKAIQDSKKVFVIAGQSRISDENRIYNAFVCPDTAAAEIARTLIEPIVRGHGYTSDEDTFFAKVRLDSGTKPAVIINKGALEYVLEHEKIATERYLQ